MKIRRRMVAVLLAAGVLSGVGGFASASAERPIPQKDHWHAAFGIWSCDRWLPSLAEGEDPTGIHTHGDGLVHIHPFDARSAGSKAVLRRFFEATFLLVDAKRIEIPKKPPLLAGSDCKGKKTETAAVVWRSVKDKQPTIVTKDIGSIRLADGQVIVLVHAPKGTVPGLPPSIEELFEPADLPLPDLPSEMVATLPALPKRPALDVTGDAPTTLTSKDIVVGKGDELKKGLRAYMRYVMYHWRTKEVLAESWAENEQPYALARFGKKRNLLGLDKGMLGMKVGGVRRLVLPPAEAFGKEGNGPILPSDTVVFYVQLVYVKK